MKILRNFLANAFLLATAFGLYQACTPPASAVEIQVPLIWTDNASNEEGFKVYFRADPALPFEVVSVIALPDTESYVHVIDVAGGETLQYKVSAYNTWLGDEQESGFSNIAEKIIEVNPGAPSSPSAASVLPVVLGGVGG